jgi:hypothetical protein
VSTTDVTITTGEHALNGMPVSVELNLQHSVNDTPGCLVHDGIEIPAQVERIDEGAARIWFVIDQPAHDRVSIDFISGRSAMMEIHSRGSGFGTMPCDLH